MYKGIIFDYGNILIRSSSLADSLEQIIDSKYSKEIGLSIEEKIFNLYKPDQIEQPQWLNVCKDSFDEYGIPFWLEGGTLLGMIRDKQIMPWDDDIDIATLNESIDLNVVGKALHEKGFNIYMREGRMKVEKNGEHISLFLYDEEGNYYVRYGFHGTGKHQLIYRFVKFVILSGLITDKKDYVRCKTGKEYFLKLSKDIILKMPMKKKAYAVLTKILIKTKCCRIGCTKIPKKHYDQLNSINFYGEVINVPSKPERYLKGYFGEKWKTPDKNWSLDKYYQKGFEYRIYETKVEKLWN